MFLFYLCGSIFFQVELEFPSHTLHLVNSFQKQLNKDIRNIRKSTSLLIFVNKTVNIYEMPLEQYNKSEA